MSAPFRYPHTREAVNQMRERDPATANSMQEERDRAIEDYISTSADGRVVTYDETITTLDDPLSELNLPTVIKTLDLPDGRWTVWSRHTANTTGGFSQGGISTGVFDALEPDNTVFAQASIADTAEVTSPSLTIEGLSVVSGSFRLFNAYGGYPPETVESRRFYIRATRTG